MHGRERMPREKDDAYAKVAGFQTIKGDEYGPIDLIVGGTPCQSFSVAGLRGGLDDDRGNLALEYCRLVDRVRPGWFTWENVPGVLSIDGGRAFGSILGAMAKLGYGFAYRILDAQYFGVPQHRRRVFVVGYLGDWRPAAAVLFERHSLSRHLAPRREAGKGASCDVAPSLVSSGRGVERTGETRGQDPVVAVCANSGDVGYCLTVSGQQSLDAETETLLAVSRAHATLDANNGSRRHNGVIAGSAVRRLTPRECERLQGFPDDFTAVPYRNKPAADGPRYKALGNSMAVPVVRWIGERIDMVDRLTVGSTRRYHADA